MKSWARKVGACHLYKYSFNVLFVVMVGPLLQPITRIHQRYPLTWLEPGTYMSQYAGDYMKYMSSGSWDSWTFFGTLRELKVFPSSQMGWCLRNPQVNCVCLMVNMDDECTPRCWRILRKHPKYPTVHGAQHPERRVQRLDIMMVWAAFDLCFHVGDRNTNSPRFWQDSP